MVVVVQVYNSSVSLSDTLNKWPSRDLDTLKWPVSVLLNFSPNTEIVGEYLPEVMNFCVNSYDRNGFWLCFALIRRSRERYVCDSAL